MAPTSTLDQIQPKITPRSAMLRLLGRDSALCVLRRLLDKLGTGFIYLRLQWVDSWVD